MTYYKKKTKKHKVGDVKDRVLYKKKSSLSRLLRYLMYVKDFDAIYNDEIKSILNGYTDNKKNKIIDYIKFKQQYIIDKIKVIEFKTGTHIKDGHISKIKDTIFIDKTNKKYNYWYAYKTKGKIIFLPLEINKKYHDNFNDINTNACHYVQVTNHKVSILTTKDGLEPVFNNKYETIGVDINVVNNFMSCSNGYIVNYDKKYLLKMFKLVKKIDNIGYSALSKNKVKQLNRIVKQNEWYFQKTISEFLDYCENNNIYDIVVENLNLACKTFIRDKETDIKYSRIVKLLRLSNIKNWLLAQAEKRGIRVHITPSNYTSQMCSECGYIDRDNRKTQENFECVNCGHIDNADHNASINIKNRFSLDVLKNSRLHKLDKYGRMTPNLSNKYVIKNLLENIYVIDT